MLAECVGRAAVRMTDEELRCEILCAQRCALETTRTRREFALLRVYCLRQEAERRERAPRGPTRTDG